MEHVVIKSPVLTRFELPQISNEHSLVENKAESFFNNPKIIMDDSIRGRFVVIPIIKFDMKFRIILFENCCFMGLISENDLLKDYNRYNTDNSTLRKGIAIINERYKTLQCKIFLTFEGRCNNNNKTILKHSRFTNLVNLKGLTKECEEKFLEENISYLAKNTNEEIFMYTSVPLCLSEFSYTFDQLDSNQCSCVSCVNLELAQITEMLANNLSISKRDIDIKIIQDDEGVVILLDPLLQEKNSTKLHKL